MSLNIADGTQNFKTNLQFFNITFSSPSDIAKHAMQAVRGYRRQSEKKGNRLPPKVI
jgi:hypothetical protein